MLEIGGDFENHIIDDLGFVRMKEWTNEFGIPCHIESTNNIGIKQWHHLKSGADSEKTIVRVHIEHSVANHIKLIFRNLMF